MPDTNLGSTIADEYNSEAVLGSVYNLQLGLISSMVGGQDAIAIVTEEVRVSCVRPQLSSLGGSGLSPPKTEEEAQYAAPSPIVILPKAGLAACGITEQYSKMTVMQWGTNPFGGSLNSTSNSKNMKSPVLRFTNTGPTMWSRRLTNQSTYNESDPYYIILPLTSTTETSSGNNSGPICTIPTSSGYLPCPCNVSEVTDTNVTYICYDIGFICPSGPRRLFDINQEDLITDSPMNENLEINHDYPRRALTEEEATSLSDYGTLLFKLVEAVKSVLSQNPLTINYEAAKYVLIFVGCLIFLMFSGIVFFRSWDNRDRKYFANLSNNSELQPKATDNSGSFINLKELFTPKSVHRINYHLKSLNVKLPEIVEGQKDYSYEVFESDIDASESEVEVDDKQDSRVVENENENENHTTNPIYKSILSESSLLKYKSIFTDFNRALIVEHDWWAVFNYPSMRLSRCLRWIGLVNDIMLTLLFDTIFFIILYPAGVCEVITTEELCISIPGAIKPTKQCQWDLKTNSCLLADPPSSFFFSAFVTLIVILLSLTPSIVMWNMIYAVVNSYPDLESIGLNSNFWFVKPAAEHNNNNNNNNDDDDDDDVFVITNQNPSAPNDQLSEMLFDENFTVDNELVYILERTKDFFGKKLYQRYVFDRNLSKKIDAVCEIMQIHPDGTPFLSVKNYAKYGSSRNRILQRIIRARKSCENILDSVEGFSGFQERDTMLCQSFILEQFTYIKRMCLSEEFYFNDKSSSPTSCEPITWILCWAYIWTIFIFTCCWIILWGAKVGTKSFVFWGELFIFAFLQVYSMR